jgi:hypothetical protein
LAAIFAIGKPVALLASADERDTRGFISMTMTRPSRGSTANWMLQPPVSTPTARITSIAMSRSSWYSRSVSVIAGATVIESPVCTPIGSRFSIEQTTTTLSLRSRISSSSYSFHPMMLSSSSTSVVGTARRPAPAMRRRSSSSYAMPLPAPPMVYDGPHHHRVAEAPHCGEAVLERRADRAARALGADAATICLNRSRSSPAWIAATLAPISSTPYCSSTPASASAMAVFSAVWPPSVASSASGPLPLDDLRHHLGRDRARCTSRRPPRVRHDRGRVAVDQRDAQALLAQHPAGLRARVVELGRLPDDDGPRADHQHRAQIRTTWHQPAPPPPSR